MIVTAAVYSYTECAGTFIKTRLGFAVCVSNVGVFTNGLFSTAIATKSYATGFEI
ncbi:hypothetical protein ACMSWR_002484 [Cronobacter dublinensis]